MGSSCRNIRGRRASDALHVGATLSEAEFKALSAHYDDAKVFEIILLCGFYRTVSYLANGLALRLGEKAAGFSVGELLPRGVPATAGTHPPCHLVMAGW